MEFFRKHLRRKKKGLLDRHGKHLDKPLNFVARWVVMTVCITLILVTVNWALDSDKDTKDILRDSATLLDEASTALSTAYTKYESLAKAHYDFVKENGIIPECVDFDEYIELERTRQDVLLGSYRIKLEQLREINEKIQYRTDQRIGVDREIVEESQGLFQELEEIQESIKDDIAEHCEGEYQNEYDPLAEHLLPITVPER